MKIDNIKVDESRDENCSIPVPEDTQNVPKLTQFSPGAG